MIDSLDKLIEPVHEESKPKELHIENEGNVDYQYPITPENEENVLKSDEIEAVTEEKKKEKSKADILANAKLQFKVLKERLNKDANENAKRKADSDIFNPKVAKFANFGVTLGQIPKEKTHPAVNSEMASFGIKQFDRSHKCPLCFSSFRAEEMTPK